VLKNGLSALAIPIAHGVADGPAVIVAGIFIYGVPATGMPLPVTILTPALSTSEVTLLQQMIASLEGEGWRVTPTGVAGAKRLVTP